jgi:hydrogenase expression/formation protein HypE
MIPTSDESEHQPDRARLPVGKLPPGLLVDLLKKAPPQDSRVLQGPGIGLDCAVIDFGAKHLVLKTDPITFATDEIGWYAVQVNANDIATSGADPRWFMLTLLLPEAYTTPRLVEELTQQVYRACRELGICVIGGHTEITYNLDRPIVVGTMLGEVASTELVTPRGAHPGDRLLLTKGIPIEATALLAREFPARLSAGLDSAEIAQAQAYLYTPGISVVRDARIARQSGRVTAMHDPTEGGLAAALWELAQASNLKITVDYEAVPVPPLAERVCRLLELDAWSAIASGALLLAVASQDSTKIRSALESEGIVCADIGGLEAGPVSVWQVNQAVRQLLPQPDQDAIAGIFAGIQSS